MSEKEKRETKSRNGTTVVQDEGDVGRINGDHHHDRRLWVATVMVPVDITLCYKCRLTYTKYLNQGLYVLLFWSLTSHGWIPSLIKNRVAVRSNRNNIFLYSSPHLQSSNLKSGVSDMNSLITPPNHFLYIPYMCHYLPFRYQLHIL